jgi:hypothetical protein
MLIVHLPHTQHTLGGALWRFHASPNANVHTNTNWILVFKNLQMADICKLTPPQIFRSLVTHLKPMAIVEIVPMPTKFVVGHPIS